MRRINALLLTSVCFAMLILPSLAFAWGGEGHQVVALIAERHLTPEAQRQIHELLGENVDISDAEVCNWADRIKREDPASAKYHYVNIPTSADGYDATRDDHLGEHLVARLEKYTAQLANKDNPAASRAEALRFVVHLVGDLHQPLHCAERNGDKGGNTCSVTFNGRKLNLHSVWDTFILKALRGKTPVAEYADAIDERATDAQRAEWRRGTFAEWATESFKIARDVVYPAVPEAGGELPADYADKNRATVELQLERGGVRLAEVLNRAMK